jgi:hypothetical protein
MYYTYPNQLGRRTGGQGNMNENYYYNQPRQQPQQQNQGGGGGMSPMQIMDYFQTDGGATSATSGETTTGETAADSSWWTDFTNWLSGSGEGAEVGSSGGEASSGESGWGTAAWVIAAIIGQNEATKATDTEFEGEKTGNVFTSDFMTEPWQGYLYQQLGWEPTAGEKFDAATSKIFRGDGDQDAWNDAGRRSLAAINYWMHPASQFQYDLAKNELGEDWAQYLFPAEYIMNDLLGG